MPTAPIKCIAIMGATATGKSRAAVAVSLAVGGEVVSMDSRQVYRGFDVGTGKATESERRGVPHHLIDALDPTEPVNAGTYARMAAGAIDGIVSRGRVPVLAGGTGLYFRALLGGIVSVDVPGTVRAAVRERCEGRDTADLHEELAVADPERAAQLSPRDRLRIVRALELMAATGRTVTELYRDKGVEGRYDALRVVLTMPRPDLRRRVADRTRELFDAGWFDEVRRLMDSGLERSAPAMDSIGYREIAAALDAGSEAADVVEAVVTATRQYAKRQETFFRGEPDAVRVDVTETGWEDAVVARARRFISE